MGARIEKFYLKKCSKQAEPVKKSKISTKIRFFHNFEKNGFS